jgi:type IV fimbrial biogenesis protein FimT
VKRINRGIEQKGFSLMELLLVLALTGMVLGLAIPSYQLMVAKTRIRVASSQLEAAIKAARKGALHHRAEVVLCGSRSSNRCDGTWEEGQLIAFKSTRKALAFLPALPPGVRVEWRANLAHNQVLEFNSAGVPAGQWGSFWLSDSSGSVQRRITINAMGRITLGFSSFAAGPPH